MLGNPTGGSTFRTPRQPRQRICTPDALPSASPATKSHPGQSRHRTPRQHREDQPVRNQSGPNRAKGNELAGGEPILKPRGRAQASLPDGEWLRGDGAARLDRHRDPRHRTKGHAILPAGHPMDDDGRVLSASFSEPPEVVRGAFDAGTPDDADSIGTVWHGWPAVARGFGPACVDLADVVRSTMSPEHWKPRAEQSDRHRDSNRPRNTSHKLRHCVTPSRLLTPPQSHTPPHTFRSSVAPTASKCRCRACWRQIENNAV